MVLHYAACKLAIIGGRWLLHSCSPLVILAVTALATGILGVAQLRYQIIQGLNWRGPKQLLNLIQPTERVAEFEQILHRATENQ